MKKLTDKEVKQIELDILEYVHNFCEENGLKYIMNYGTLIGAVRHKGFIPWDDDIDISMPRADYEKLIASFPKNGRYKILDHRTSKDYFNNFVKVIDTNTKIVDNRNDKTYESGLFIDIFPMDRFDDMKAVDKTYNLESFKLLSFSKHCNIVYGDSVIKDMIRSVCWFFLKPVSPTFFAKKIDKASAKYTKDNGKYIGLLASKFKEKEVLDFDPFKEIIDMPFEGVTLKGPKEYDKLLRQYYGDYMQLPPLEKRKGVMNAIKYSLLPMDEEKLKMEYEENRKENRNG